MSHLIRPFVGVNPHRMLIADRVRTDAYRHAIEAVVRPGMRVLDIGTGSGILAMMAARAGAQVAQANGLADRITFHEKDSRELALDGQIDVVVSECMGNFFVTDEMQEAVADARRFLKPGGRFIPERVDLLLAPVFFPHLDEISFWDNDHYDLDFRSVGDLALHYCYVRHIDPALLSGPGVVFDRLPLASMRQDLDQTVTLEVTRSNTLHGICGWFDAHLAPDVVLSTRPGAPRTHWAQTLFPVPPLPALAGDTLEVRLRIDHAGDTVRRVRWTGALRRGDATVGTFDQDTDRRLPEA